MISGQWQVLSPPVADPLMSVARSDVGVSLTVGDSSNAQSEAQATVLQKTVRTSARAVAAAARERRGNIRRKYNKPEAEGAITEAAFLSFLLMYLNVHLAGNCE
jgi:hypothetical protein